MWVLKCSTLGDDIKPIFSTTVSLEDNEYALTKEQQEPERLWLLLRRKARPKARLLPKALGTGPIESSQLLQHKGVKPFTPAHPAEAARSTCASSKGSLAQGTGHF